MKKISFKGDTGPIDIELKDITFAERCKFNDIIYGKTFNQLVFSDYVRMVRAVTALPDEALNALSDRDITMIADKAYLLINHKKK